MYLNVILFNMYLSGNFSYFLCVEYIFLFSILQDSVNLHKKFIEECEARLEVCTLSYYKYILERGSFEKEARKTFKIRSVISATILKVFFS